MILILGDQLSPNNSALRKADKERDVVVMAEVMAEATYVPHHPKKIALVLAAMRKFAASLVQRGWTVAYTRLDDEPNTGSIQGELIRRASELDLTRPALTNAPRTPMPAARSLFAISTVGRSAES